MKLQLCSKHWAAIRQAMKDRKLDKLGRQTGQEMIGDRLHQLTTGEKLPFDPLMQSVAMIYGRAIEELGQAELDGPGECCPVCKALDRQIGDGAYWIDGPADAVLEYAKAEGLLTEH